MAEPAGAEKMYHRMAGWYNDAAESAALRAAWGAYPAAPGELEAWPGFVAVTNAFLDHQGQREPLQMEEREVPARSSEEGEAEATGVVLEGAVEWVNETLSELTNETLREWVKLWCKGKKKGLPHISTWNTSQVTDMSRLFFGSRKFNDDISAWNTSSVTTMKEMFGHEKFRGKKGMAFNQDLGAWDTSKVTDMSDMFAGCRSFTGANIGRWDTSSVTSMAYMFAECDKFNEDITSWSVGNVETTEGMFIDAKSFNRPVGEWSNFEAVKNTSHMFNRAKKFNKPIGN